MIIVDLIPAGSRPYVGGSRDGTVWDLVIGYNGLGRVFGGEGPTFGGGGGQAPPSAAYPDPDGCSTRSSADRSPGYCRSPSSA
jgi:hypothetical protein